MEEIQKIIFPKISGEYKVVQFQDKDVPYLRFAKESGDYGDYHEFILERFASELGLECTQIKGRDSMVSMIPDSSQYKFVGAGRCELSLEEKTASFKGNSYDYSVGINRDHLEMLKREIPEWNID